MSAVIFSFAAGLASFFAPCLLPLLPIYLAFITGLSVDELKVSAYKHKQEIILASLVYILGFTLIFAALGTTAAGFGYLLREYKNAIQIAGGIFIIFLGLDMLGAINFAFTKKEFKLTLPLRLKKYKYINAFFLGVVFALAWTPCASAPLGSILTLAAVHATAAKGAFLLAIYSLGISLPFLLSALILVFIPNLFPKFKNYFGKINIIVAVFMIILGLMLVTDTFKYLNFWLSKILGNSLI